MTDQPGEGDRDETAGVSLIHRINLELADAYVAGWKAMVCLELDAMRREFPYADELELRLSTRRKGSLP